MLSSDAFRSFFFILLSAALVFAIAKNWIKVAYGSIAIALLGLIDLWQVDKRYLNKENFEKSFWDNQFQPTAADQAILQDKGLNHRVLNLGAHDFSEPHHAAVDAGFDRGDGFADPIGNFVLGEAFKVEHLDHLALVVVEFHDCRTDEIAFLVGADGMDGCAVIHRLNVFEPYLVLEAHAALVGAKTVDGFIAGYGYGPCHWLTPGGIVHRGFLPKHEHDFLSDIFGICFVV
jgi:hypothetical protein